MLPSPRGTAATQLKLLASTQHCYETIGQDNGRRPSIHCRLPPFLLLLLLLCCLGVLDLFLHQGIPFAGFLHPMVHHAAPLIPASFSKMLRGHHQARPSSLRTYNGPVPGELDWAREARSGPQQQEVDGDAEFWLARKAQQEREARSALLGRKKAPTKPLTVDQEADTLLEEAAWDRTGAEAEDSEDWTIMRGTQRRRFPVVIPNRAPLPNPKGGEAASEVDENWWHGGTDWQGQEGSDWYNPEWDGQWEGTQGGWQEQPALPGSQADGALQPWTPTGPRYDWANPEPWSERADAVTAAVREMTTLNLPPLYTAMLLHELAKNQAWRSQWIAAEEWPVLLNAYTQLVDTILPSVVTQNATELTAIAVALSDLADRATRLRRFLSHHEGKVLMTAMARQAEAPAVLETFNAQEASRLLTAFAKLDVRDDELVEALSHRLADPKVLGHLTAGGVSSVFWSLAKVGVPIPQTLAKGLVDHVKGADLSRVFGPQDVANILWSMATTGMRDERLIVYTGDRICQLGFLPTCDARSVADMVWALGVMDVRNITILTALSDRIMHPGFLRFFDTNAVSNVAWAFAVLNRGTKALYDRIGSRLMADNFLYLLNPLETSNVVWAYGKLGIQNEVVMLALANRIMQPEFLDACDATAVANFAWAYAKLGLYSDVLMRGLRTRIMSPGFLAAVDPQAMTNLLWAFATLKFQDPALFVAMGQLILKDDMLDQFTMPQVVNIVWAYARLGIPKEKATVEALLDRIQQRLLVPDNLKQVKNPEVANLLWGYTALNLHNVPLFEAMAAHIKSQPQSMRLCDNGNIDALCWAYTTANVKDVGLMELIAQRLLSDRQVLASTHPRSIGNITRAFATFGIRNEEVFAAITTRLLAPNSNLVSRFDPESLAATLWSYGRLAISNKELMARLAERILTEGFISQASPQSLVHLVWSFASIGIPHMDLLERLSRRLLQPAILSQLNVPMLVDLMWAHNRLGLLDDQILAATTQQAMSLPAYDTAELAKALAKAGVKSQPLLTRLALCIVQDGIIHSFGPTGLAKIVWAFNKLGSRNSGLFISIAKQLEEVDDDVVVAVLRAFVIEGVTDVPLLQTIRQRIAGFDGPQLGAAAQALVEEGSNDEAMIEAIARRALDGEVLLELDAEDMVPLVVALSGEVIGKRHDEAMAALAERIFSFTPAAVAAVTEGFTQLEVKDDEVWDSIPQRILQFDSTEITEVALAFTELGVTDPDCVQAVVDRATYPKVLVQLTPGEVASLASAFRKLKVPDQAVAPLAQRMHQLPASEVATMAMAMVKQGVQDSTLEATLLDRVTSFDPEEVVACARTAGPKFLREQSLGTALASRIMKFGPDQLAQTALRLQENKVKSEQLTAAVAQRVLDFDVEALAEMLATLEAAEAVPEYLLTSVTRRILQLDATGLAAFAGALIKVGVHSTAVRQNLSDRLMHLSPSNLATAIHAIAALGPEATDILAPVAKRVADMGANTLATIATALAGPTTPDEAISSAVVRRIGQLDAKQLVEVCQAFQQKGLTSGQFAMALASRAGQPGIASTISPGLMAEVVASCPALGEVALTEFSKRIMGYSASEVAAVATAMEHNKVEVQQIQDSISQRIRAFAPAQIATAAKYGELGDTLVSHLLSHIKQLTIRQVMETIHEFDLQEVTSTVLQSHLSAYLLDLDAPGLVTAAQAVQELGLQAPLALAALRQRMLQFQGSKAMNLVLSLAKAGVRADSIIGPIGELLSRPDTWSTSTPEQLLKAVTVARKWSILTTTMASAIAARVLTFDSPALLQAVEGFAVLQVTEAPLLQSVVQGLQQVDLVSLGSRGAARAAVACAALGIRDEGLLGQLKELQRWGE